MAARGRITSFYAGFGPHDNGNARSIHRSGGGTLYPLQRGLPPLLGELHPVSRLTELAYAFGHGVAERVQELVAVERVVVEEQDSFGPRAVREGERVGHARVTPANVGRVL